MHRQLTPIAFLAIGSSIMKTSPRRNFWPHPGRLSLPRWLCRKAPPIDNGLLWIKECLFLMTRRIKLDSISCATSKSDMTPSIRSSDGADTASSPYEHSLASLPATHHFTGFLVYRHHRRFVYHNSPPPGHRQEYLLVPKSIPILLEKHFFEFAEHNFNLWLISD